MPLVLSGDISGRGFAPSAFRSGAPLKVALGYNSTVASKVFSARSVYEEVPGRLRVYTKPAAVGNTMAIRAHIFWGGWSSTSIDVAAQFRIYKTVDDGINWTPAGDYGNAATPAGANVATGYYRYNTGNSDGSAEECNILIKDTITSTAPTIYALFWGCGYEAGSRTLYWNRSINHFSGQAYNPTHLCVMEATEYKQ